MVDTHCHLFFDELYSNIDELVDTAKQNSVDYMICPATNLETARQSIAITEKFENVYAAVGIHPHDTSNFNDATLIEIEKLLQHPKVVAVGEIGLDYYYDYSPKEKQQFAFREQLKLAKDHDLPVIIHNRDSSADLMKIFESEIDGKLTAQFHCFNGDFEMARRVVELRSFISFTGNITYPKNEELRNIAKRIELENLLLETDSPFMTPIPFRGKRNSPANLKYIAKQIAEVHELRIEDVIQSTDYNAFKVFGIGTKPNVAYTYQIGDALYINITNRCNADCSFCDRKGDAIVNGYNLKMPKDAEPPAEVYYNEVGDPKRFSEIVFCGFGEPTIRLDIVKQVSKYVKDRGGKTRLNTDGHGNVINKRNIVPELVGLIDSVSISLNSFNPKQYSKLMGIDESMFSEMINFTKEAKIYLPEIVMTIVGLSEVDAEKARNFVENDVGVKFRAREYF